MSWPDALRTNHRTGDVKYLVNILLFLVGGGASCAQEGTHYHDYGGKGSHRDNDDNDQDVILTTPDTCFTSRRQRLD